MGQTTIDFENTACTIPAEEEIPGYVVSLNMKPVSVQAFDDGTINYILMSIGSVSVLDTEGDGGEMFFNIPEHERIEIKVPFSLACNYMVT